MVRIRSEDISFGPRIISEFQRRREAEGRIWAKGYTQGELDSAQERFGLVFPPDMVSLYLDRRPVRAWDWRSDYVEIRSVLELPLEGLMFDVEECGLWWPEWGDRPGDEEGRAEVLRTTLHAAPQLVPLLSHRFIPSDPCEAGNPVFSIHQSDVICYGTDINEYFGIELEGQQFGSCPAKYIRFWSDLVERAYVSEFYPGAAATRKGVEPRYR